MTNPNPPGGQVHPGYGEPATGTEHPADGTMSPEISNDALRHASPHGVMGEIERGMDRISARMIAEVRAVVTPARLQELALLTRELAAGAKDAPEVLAWLTAHGL